MPEVRRWAAERVAAVAPALTSPVLASIGDVDRVVAAGRAAQPDWAARPAAERAATLRRAADELEARRGELVTVMAAEGGKTVAEADPEVSEAIDFARYYADRALELEPSGRHASTDGARFTPTAMTLVTPPWNFPVAIPIGGALAALAAGSAVVLKPAPSVPGCAEVAVAAVRAALAHGGAPADVLQVVRTDEGDVGRALVAHRDVDTVLLTGSIETARLFSSWRAAHDGGPRVYAETSGKNALVITSSADYDLAVADLVKSAFGHAGQKCSAASLVILVGSAGRSERLRHQLVDAVESVRVGWPTSLDATMGPLIEPPTGKLARALTSLEPGETWLVEPQPLDDTGRLWSPGLKDGVAPGSFLHLTECFGPVLGIMRADTLEEALALQNATPFGLTGGLHSLDEDEIEQWLAAVHVGNAYVNRHITGAIVQRQPFGGWKDSVVGPGAKAGGPNYVAQLGAWVPERAPVDVAEPVERVRQAFDDYIELLQSDSDRAWLRAAVGSDAAAWAGELGQEIDRTALAVESNVLRYRPLPTVTVRAGHGASAVELVRLLLAAELVGTPARASLDPAVASVLGLLDAPMDGSAPAGVRRLHRVIDAVESAARARRPRAVGRRFRSGASRRRRGGGSAARARRRGRHRAGRTSAGHRPSRAADRAARAGGLADAAPLRPPATSVGCVSGQSLSSLSSARCATSAMWPLTPGSLACSSRLASMMPSRTRASSMIETLPSWSRSKASSMTASSSSSNSLGSSSRSDVVASSRSSLSSSPSAMCPVWTF